VLDAKLEALADALIAKALQGDVSALREALHQLVGRPETVVSHEQDPDRPIRIVVESISSRSASPLPTWRPRRARSRSYRPARARSKNCPTSRWRLLAQSTP
jgi:hypothetical protein